MFYYFYFIVIYDNDSIFSVEIEYVDVVDVFNFRFYCY